MEQLIIPREYTLTFKKEKFHLYDSGQSIDGILLFSTKYNFDILSQAQHWFSDGTFKVVPKLFGQLYTIHGVKYNNVILSVFILMPDKSQNSYERAFEALKNLQNNLNPSSIMIDFKQSSINAFKKSFPGIYNRGCFFHFTQNIGVKFKKFQKFLKSIQVILTLL